MSASTEEKKMRKKLEKKRKEAQEMREKQLQEKASSSKGKGTQVVQPVEEHLLVPSSRDHQKGKDKKDKKRNRKDEELPLGPANKSTPPPLLLVEGDEREKKRQKKEGKEQKRQKKAGGHRSTQGDHGPSISSSESCTKQQPLPPPPQPLADLESLSPDALLAALSNPRKAREALPSTSTSEKSLKSVSASSKKKNTTPNSKGKGKASVETADLDPADVLATKWMTAQQLKEYAQAENITVREGFFTPQEDSSLHIALTTFRTRNSLTDAELTKLIFTPRTSKATSAESRELVNALWTALAYSVPLRPLTSVYARVKRIKSPMHAMGPWTAEEETNLRNAVLELGPSAWTKISEQVGRLPSDCRDHWRGEMASGSERSSGKWSDKEIKKLSKAVNKLGENWEAVRSKMKTRTAHQCREKWVSIMGKKDSSASASPQVDEAEEIEAAGSKKVFRPLPAKYRSNLVFAVCSLDPAPDSLSDINWSEVLAADSVFEGRTERRMKTEFERHLGEAQEDGAGESFDAQLKWLKDRYPDKGKTHSKENAARFLRKRERLEKTKTSDSALVLVQMSRSGSNERSETPPGTPSAFKSKDLIESDDELDSE
ncbi:hypothetical protein T439DRAFT_351070 [Meredithblackwellia eburnea MCA 4105]